MAAGNSNGANACNYSPARAANAITVGSTTIDGCALVVLEHRHVSRHLCAGVFDPVGVVYVEYSDGDVERNFNGLAARRGRGRALQASESVRFVNDDPKCDR